MHRVDGAEGGRLVFIKTHTRDLAILDLNILFKVTEMSRNCRCMVLKITEVQIKR